MSDWSTLFVTAGMLFAAGYMIGAFFRVPFLMAASALTLAAAITFGFGLPWMSLLLRALVLLSALHAGYLLAVARAGNID